VRWSNQIRTHWGAGRSRRRLHLGEDVGRELLAPLKELRDQAIRLVPERPHFVRAAGQACRQLGAGLTVSVQAKDRAPQSVLEPADDELAIIGILGIAAVEPARCRSSTTGSRRALCSAPAGIYDSTEAATRRTSARGLHDPEGPAPDRAWTASAQALSTAVNHPPRPLARYRR